MREDDKHELRMLYGARFFVAVASAALIGWSVCRYWPWCLGFCIAIAGIYVVGYGIERAIAAWNRRTPPGEGDGGRG